MITSTANSKIKNIVQLSTSAKARREQNAFIAEGIKMFIEAPHMRIKEVYVSEELLNRINSAKTGDNADEDNRLLLECSKKLEETGFTEVSSQVFKKMSDTVTPQGIISVIEKKAYELEDLTDIDENASLHVLILEAIQDPGNLGTMLRTAEAAGYDFILASEGTVDVYNPKVIRSTMGSVYRIPVVYTDRLKEKIGVLKGIGIKTYAAHLKGKQAFNRLSYGSRVAVMIGNEANGLSDEIAGESDEYIRIPMCGQVESLNAAVAASLIMFETFRTAGEF